MKRFLAVMVSVAVVLTFVTWATAAEKATNEEPRGDRKFVTGATWSGTMEVEAGKIASEKAQNAEVKSFAQRMVTDHTKANQELASIAEKKKLVPPPMGKKFKNEMDKLNKYSGADFDKQYMDRMIKDHKDTISLFEKEAKDGKDEDLKAFASKTLPVLREHHQMAQDIYNKVKEKK